MTDEQKNEVAEIIMNMDDGLQNYVIDMVRHLKSAEVILNEKYKANQITDKNIA